MNIKNEFNKEKLKQKFLIATAFVLIICGYLNFNFNNKQETLEVSSRSNEINLGDVELVNSKPINSDIINITNISDAIVPNDDSAKSFINNNENIVNYKENTVNNKDINETNNISYNINGNNKDGNSNNMLNISESSNRIETEDTKNDNNYFEETKIERDRMYSEILETYQKMIDSQNISSEQKAIAIQEISNISNIKNGIMISENLIKNKGFEEVVVLVNNGKVNVVLQNKKLNVEQISQIQNIVEKQFNTKIENINISFID